MKSGAAGLANGKQPADGRLAIHIGEHAAALVMGGRHHRDGLGFTIEPELEQCAVDVGKALTHEALGLVGDVQINTGRGGAFQFAVDGTGDDVAWGERAAGIAFAGEILALGIDQHAALAAHRLADEERARLRPGGRGIVKTGGVELDELHVGDRCAGTPAKRHSITGGGVGIGCVEIDLAAAAGGKDHAVRAEHAHLTGFFLEHIGPQRAVLGHRAELGSGDHIDHEMIFQDGDAGRLARGLDEATGNLPTGGILGMQDPPVAVTTFLA